MGTSFSCCRYDKREKKQSIEELNLEETDINFDKRKQDRIITIGSYGMNDLQNSPKYNYLNSNRKNDKEEFKEHIKKASDNLNNFNIDNKIDNLERPNNTKISECPELLLYLTNIQDINAESKVININYLGYKDSQRCIKDGIVYFGNYLESNVNKEIDVLLKHNDNEDKSLGKHFCIYFVSETVSYNIRDLGKGTGVFYKINSETYIRNNSVICLDENYIFVTIKANDVLNLKIYIKNGSEALDPMNFNPSKNGISIGRSSECDVSINEKNLSRFHCRIYYENNIGWIIHDGYLKSNSSSEYILSKNGTWLYLQNDMRIYNGFIFKNNDYVFEVSYNL